MKRRRLLWLCRLRLSTSALGSQDSTTCCDQCVKGGVAYDLIPRGSVLRRLYEWDGLVAFVAAILGETRLYRHADPLAALNINVFAGGQGLNRHFDSADFAVTLSLQTAEEGGDFEIVPVVPI